MCLFAWIIYLFTRCRAILWYDTSKHLFLSIIRIFSQRNERCTLKWKGKARCSKLDLSDANVIAWFAQTQVFRQWICQHQICWDEYMVGTIHDASMCNFQIRFFNDICRKRIIRINEKKNHPQLVRYDAIVRFNEKTTK